MSTAHVVSTGLLLITAKAWMCEACFRRDRTFDSVDLVILVLTTFLLFLKLALPRSSLHAARYVSGLPRLCSSDTSRASRRNNSQASVSRSHAARCVKSVPCRCCYIGDASAQGFFSKCNKCVCCSNGLAATVVPWMPAITHHLLHAGNGIFQHPRDRVNLHS